MYDANRYATKSTPANNQSRSTSNIAGDTKIVGKTNRNCERVKITLEQDVCIKRYTVATVISQLNDTVMQCCTSLVVLSVEVSRANKRHQLERVCSLRTRLLLQTCPYFVKNDIADGGTRSWNVSIFMKSDGVSFPALFTSSIICHQAIRVTLSRDNDSEMLQLSAEQELIV